MTPVFYCTDDIRVVAITSREDVPDALSFKGEATTALECHNGKCYVGHIVLDGYRITGVNCTSGDVSNPKARSGLVRGCAYQPVSLGRKLDGLWTQGTQAQLNKTRAGLHLSIAPVRLDLVRAAGVSFL